MERGLYCLVGRGWGGGGGGWGGGGVRGSLTPSRVQSKVEAFKNSSLTSTDHCVVFLEQESCSGRLSYIHDHQVNAMG